jgi:hypothetical protein
MTEKTNDTPMTMTPEQQGVFFSLMQQRVPSWVLESSTDIRGALRTSLLASYRSRDALAQTLSDLNSPESFCAPLLAKAMSDKLGRSLDMEGVVFQHIRSTSSLLGLRKKLVTPIDRDLLMAACENFESSETQESNYHESSLIYIPERINGRFNDILSIKPHEFAQLCRTLDLGKQYQAHIKALFDTQQLRENAVASAKDQFEVDMHIAFMKKHVSADVYSMLKSVKEGASTIKLGKNTLGYQGLQLLEVKLHGAVFIGPVSEQAGDDYRCVVYLPGDPVHPLKEYASFKHFESELSRRLRTAGFRTFFMRYILLKDQPLFHTELETRLLSRKTPPLPADSIYVPVEGFELKDDLFLTMFHQRSAQVSADARLLVVPTDDEDEKTRLDRLETYKTISLNTLLLFSSFVPVLGEVMFAIAGVQLLAEVYEGIESWSRGEQEQATDHLFDVIENLILLAAVAGGGVAVGKGFRTLKTSSFVERLRSVSVGSGATRLWKPDLKAYRQTSAMPRGLPADEQGLVTWRERQYLRTDTDTYAMRPVQGTDLWEIEHPRTPERYSPVMETNGAGAWRHDSELPQEWSLLRLFRRLGYREEDLSDTEALQLLAASGLDDKLLRRQYLDRSKPMATLVDTARRFRADKAVSRFIDHMHIPSSAPQADADLQLHLLTSLATWPQDASVSITRIGGSEVRRYGPASASRPIKIAEDLIRKGQFYPTLLKSLDTQARTRLMGVSATNEALQVQSLISLIAKQAELKKLPIFARVYQRSDVIKEPTAAPLREKFTNLPASVADELVQNADVTEWGELAGAKIPLRLAEEARRYAQVVRLNRAYEGLYLDAASGLDSDRLVLNNLKHLPGWANDVFVEIVEWAVQSEEKASIGSSDAAHKLVIKAYPDRYEVSDGNDKVLCTLAKRTRANFFRALWEGLPVNTRTGLGVEADDAGVGLRKKITDLALQRRAAIAQAIGIKAVRIGYRSPMGLADRLVENATLPGLPPSGGVSTRSSALVQRARELYPSHSPTQIDRLLTTLGTDEVLAIRALEALRQEFQTIRYALERWVNRQTHYQEGDGPQLKVPQHSKERAARSILRAWRKEGDYIPDTPEMLYGLSFDAQPLGELPVIVGNFSHIGTLKMDKVGTNAGLNAFLHNFTQLRTLSLTGNHLSRIPQAIASMSKLTSLDLSDNQIKLTPESNQLLSGNDQLHSLDLSFNRALGRTPTVTGLLQLQHLALRDTGIVDWPVGVNDLYGLRTLDLRDNLIEQIPETVFKAPSTLNRGTNINGNPLSASSVQRIAAYQQSSGISLGILTADYRQVAALHPDLERRGTLWMSGLTEADKAPKEALWNSLSVYPRSRDFFHLLAQLHDTADFNLLEMDLSRRVWDVLEAAAEDDALRRALFQMARIGRVGAEEVSALFSDIEVRVLCYQAVVAARSGERTLEGELVRLLRGLFRLQEVERQALIEIGRRVVSGSFSRAQAQELSLTYRVRLAQRLDLPAQPREMNFVRDVDVSPEQLENAYQEVVKAETSTALPASIKARGFWREYLLATYPDEFRTIDVRTAQAIVQLDAQVELSRAIATQRMKAIIENNKNQFEELLTRRTTEALARHPGLTALAGESAEA